MTKAPIATWLHTYRREWLRADVLAGLTAAAMVLPKAMALAVIAGLPVQAGLYTALAAMLVYPLLGSSRVLSVTTTTPIAILTAAQVVAVSTPGSGTGAGAVAATLALLVGMILILARLLRLGFLADFISKPVLVGFEAGVGVVLVVAQLPYVLGVHVASKTTVGTLLELPATLAHIHWTTMLVAAIGLAVLLALPRLNPRLPAALAWVVLSVVASAAFGLQASGVQLVGAVPAGLPSLSLPDTSLVPRLWPAALAIALMSFTESAAAARSFRHRDDAPVDANRELLALGAVNMASAVVGGLPAGGGASQSAVAESAGTRSQMAQWVNAAVAVACLLFLSGVIALLPQAALGALILVSAATMIKTKDFRAIARIRRMELSWALVTFAGVILVGTLAGILVAVAISVLALLYQASHPPVYAVAYNRAREIFRRVGDDPSDETFPGLLMLRIEGRIHFANAANAGAKMQALVDQTRPRVIVLECSATPDIEYTALSMLIEAEQKLRERGVSLWLAGLNPDVLPTIERSPLPAAIGRERIYVNLRRALEAYRASGDQPSSTAGEAHAIAPA